MSGGPIVIWRLTDGRRGHENQTAGLVTALARRRATLACRVEIAAGAGGLVSRWPGLGSAISLARGSGVSALPDPDLILAAGSATHLPALAARRRRGGRVVVLMKPGLPLRWFDLCIAPDHDDVPEGPRVILTRGALNAMRPLPFKTPHQGIILLGGPSRHNDWSTAGVVAQIQAIAAEEPSRMWQMVTSPRTPPATVERLDALSLANAAVVAFDAVGAGWLRETLPRTERVWVTADSVSMVYESLSAGAATGILEVPGRAGRQAGLTRRRAARLADLADEGLVTTFTGWRSGRGIRAPRRALAEAERCADWIVSTWLDRTS